MANLCFECDNEPSACIYVMYKSIAYLINYNRKIYTRPYTIRKCIEKQ